MMSPRLSGIPTERLQVVKMRMPNLGVLVFVAISQIRIHWIHCIGGSLKRWLKRKMNGWRWRDESDEYNYILIWIDMDR